MESGILAIISILIEKGIIADTSLFLIIIALLLVVYVYVLKPIKDRIFKVPTDSSIKELIDEAAKLEVLNIDEASKKLDRIIDVLDKVAEVGKDSHRDVSEIKRDIETIKQILNQFQGHLMYNRTNSDFGNRELK